MSSNLGAGYKRLRKKLGFGYVRDVIPLDATLVKGSHGAVDIPTEYYPLLIGKAKPQDPELEAISVKDIILASLLG